MVHHTPGLHSKSNDELPEPNAQLVHRKGWKLKSMAGPYCVAWRDGGEIVLVWRDNDWHPVAGAYRKAG